MDHWIKRLFPPFRNLIIRFGNQRLVNRLKEKPDAANATFGKSASAFAGGAGDGQYRVTAAGISSGDPGVAVAPAGPMTQVELTAASGNTQRVTLSR